MNSKILEKCGNLIQRHIILCGEYEEVVSFLEKYSNLMTIKAVVTNHKSDVKKQPYENWGIDCILFEEINLDNELIIICDKTRFGVHKKIFWHHGLEEYKDYMSVELIECILTKKDLMLCMGTHLMQQVCRLMSESKNLSEKYSIVFYPEKELKEAYMNRFQELLHVARCCDVFVRSSCQEKFYYLKVPEAKQLSAECKIITVSDYGFGGYFPQVLNDRDVLSNYFFRERMRLEMSYETLAFSRVDKEMELLCEDGMPVKNIVEKLMDEHYFEREYVQSVFKNEICRFKALEKEDDIKLGEFIEQHANECLCRNLNEWNEPVVSYVTEKLLHVLGVPNDLLLSIEERQKKIEECSGSEILIYPSVRDALQLTAELQSKKYKVVTFYDTKYMTAWEYAEYLATYLYRSMDLMKFTGLDQSLRENEQE
ncbi:MAG: hypothetical protein IJ291_06100 [Lachnospiraceae bacterium]|nr:hypothetical protein [Lachnospiraceae bacterium]